MSYHIPKDKEAERIEIFKPYQVTEELMKLAKPDAIFMHCLPQTIGNEVVERVAYGPNSVIFDQAENRLHVQKAIMITLMDRYEHLKKDEHQFRLSNT